MHFRKALNSACLAAEDFVDGNMNPVCRSLIIRDVVIEIPPAAGKGTPGKACFYFENMDKKAFLANGEIKKIARLLRKANTDDWKGACLKITSGPKKFKGESTTGMIVVEAFFQKGGQPAIAPQNQEPQRETNAQGVVNES